MPRKQTQRSRALRQTFIPGPLRARGAQAGPIDTFSANGGKYSITTGLSATLSCKLSDTPNSANFCAVYDEYRILKIKFFITALNPAMVGSTKVYIDENDATVPNSASAAARVGALLPNASANPKSYRVMTWSAKDYTDLSYTSTGSPSFSPCFLKLFTNSTEYGTPNSGGDAFEVMYTMTVQFRGVGAK
jgi:hypothetical protein